MAEATTVISTANCSNINSYISSIDTVMQNKNISDQPHKFINTQSEITTDTVLVCNENNQRNSAKRDVLVAKKVPKKRKFDPEEYERHNVESSFTETMAPTANVTHSVVVTPQTSTIDYSYAGGGLKRSEIHCDKFRSIMDGMVEVLLEEKPQHCETTYKPDGLSSVSVIDVSGKKLGCDSKLQKPEIDLSEWKEHRVLAKRNDVYLPGVVKQAIGISDIVVEFDYNQEVIFSDVLGAGKYDVISDASPSLGQVTLGARVCVRKNTDQCEFVEGVVCEIRKKSVQFLVQVIGQNTERLVKRADLRLLLPPWWDELECQQGYENGQKCFSSVLNEEYISTQLHGAPLHVEANYLYNNSATSPIHIVTPVTNTTTPLSGHSGSTGMSNGSDDFRRRQGDYEIESDDDLRREILFTADAGKLFSR